MVPLVLGNPHIPCASKGNLKPSALLLSGEIPDADGTGDCCGSLLYANAQLKPPEVKSYKHLGEGLGVHVAF